jgi:hypothetical protein
MGDPGLAFRTWHTALLEKIRNAVSGDDAEYLQTMEALLAFPTIKIGSGHVYDLDSQSERTSHMVSYALAIDPENMPPGLEQTQYAEIIKKIKAGVPMSKVMGLTREGVENYGKFTRWVKNAYLSELKPDMIIDGRNVTQMKNRLRDELVDRVNQMRQQAGAINEIVATRRPSELDDIEQFSDQRLGLLGRAGNAILDATYRPIESWILDAWDDFEEMAKHLWGTIRHPIDFLTRTGPAALEALLMATKVLFQAYFSRVIHDEFKDRPITDRHGNTRMVSYTKVRRAARTFLTDAVGIKPYTTHEFTKMGELMNTGAWREEMGGRYGTQVSYAYTPSFRNNKMVMEQTENDPSRVKFLGYQSAGGNPMADIGVDIPILKPKDLHLSPDMIETIRDQGARGLTFRGKIADKIPPEWESWYRAYANNFMVEKFRKLHDRVPDSRDTPPIKEFKMKVDLQGNLRIQVRYNMESAFEGHRHVYHEIFGRSITSNKSTSSGLRGERDTENEPTMVYTGRLSQESSRLQHKMNLIEALLGRRR